MKNLTSIILFSVVFSLFTATASAQINAPSFTKVCIHNQSSALIIRGCDNAGKCTSGLPIGFTGKLSVNSTGNFLTGHSMSVQLYYLAGIEYVPTARVSLAAGDVFYVTDGKKGTGKIVHKQCF